MSKERKIANKSKECWNSLQKTTKVLIWILVAIMAISPFILYVYYFCGGISTEHKLWSEFGDYIAGIAAVLNLIAFIVFNVLVRTIDKRRAEQASMLHAEELVVDKLQVQLEIYHNLYIAFEKSKSRNIAKDTFEFLQPLMTYLYYLKSIDFLPDTTKQRIAKIHKSLFDISDLLYTYAEEIDQDKEENQQIVDLLRAYRDLYRMLIELEVLMTGDIAGVNLEEGKSNYVEVRLGNDK